jgi:hypothetical protein
VVRLVNEEDNAPAIWVFLSQCLLERVKHGGRTVRSTLEPAFFANERKHIAKRNSRVANKDRLAKRLDSCLTGTQDRCLSESRRPQNRHQCLSRFDTADQRVQSGFMA